MSEIARIKRERAWVKVRERESEREREREREVKRSFCVLTQVSEQEIMARLWDINDAFASLSPDNGGFGERGGKFIALLSKRSDISPSAVKFHIAYLELEGPFCGAIRHIPFLPHTLWTLY